jgi:hypothetical protein
MSDDTAKTLIELELKNALQGDPDSIRRVADRLQTPQSAQPSRAAAEAAAAAFNQAVTDRAEFLKAVDQFKREYPDLTERADLWQNVVQADAHLAQREPDAPFLTRLRWAGAAVRKWQDETESGDEGHRSSVVEHMKRTRGAHRLDDELGDAPEPTELNYAETGAYDLFDEDRSNAIAQMAAARRAGRETLGD